MPGQKNYFIRVVSILLLVSLTVVFPTNALFAHGVEGHDNEAETFTNYDAVKKSMELFDKLISMKKINHDWEINFSDIFVQRSANNNQEKVIVKITREKGQPEALFIFFDEDGQYIGSNFKGR